jgi:hypothetical protein
MKRVGPDDIIKINEAYLACGTYSGAAAATGWSASTVKKYVISDYKSEQKVEAADIELPPIEEIAEKLPPWYDITCLTPEEEKEIKLLWKEILI